MVDAEKKCGAAKANREAIATPAGNSKLRHNLDKDRNAN